MCASTSFRTSTYTSWRTFWCTSAPRTTAHCAARARATASGARKEAAWAAQLCSRQTSPAAQHFTTTSAQNLRSKTSFSPTDPSDGASITPKPSRSSLTSSKSSSTGRSRQSSTAERKPTKSSSVSSRSPSTSRVRSPAHKETKSSSSTTRTKRSPSAFQANASSSSKTCKSNTPPTRANEGASGPRPHPSERRTRPKEVREWQRQKVALKEKFPEGWKPMKKLSPETHEGIRAIHQQYPDVMTTQVLANKFEVSPEAIRRILKSKWRPSAAEEEDRRERWERRGESVYRRWVEERGANPPKKWRQRGIGGGPRRLSQDREYQKRITFEREGVGWREPGVETAIPWG